MNQEFKALIDLAFDIFQIGQDAVMKKNIFLMLPDFYNLITTIPAVNSHWSDLQNEIKDLSGTSQELDLLNYIKSKFGSVGDQKAQNILNASLDLIQCGIQKIQALEKAIRS